MGALRNGVALFSLPELLLVEGCGGGAGAALVWVTLSWGRASFGLGRTNLPMCPLGA